MTDWPRIYLCRIDSCYIKGLKTVSSASPESLLATRTEALKSRDLFAPFVPGTTTTTKGKSLIALIEITTAGRRKAFSQPLGGPKSTQ
jgi:hypothetical protein